MLSPQEQHESVLAQVNSLDQQGREYHSLGQLPEAEIAFAQSLQVLRDFFGPSHPHVAGALQNLARIRSESGFSAEAIALGTEALHIQQKLRGPDHPAVAGALLNLSGHHYAAADYPRTQELLEQALSLFELHHGPRSLPVSTCLNNLGRLHECCGNPRQGALLHQQAVDIRQEILGDHPETAFSFGNWGAALAADAQWPEALHALSQALACYTRLGLEATEAAEVCRKNSEICRETIGEGFASPNPPPAGD